MPYVKGYQKKGKRRPQDEIERLQSQNVASDARLFCLAAMRDVWITLNRHRRSLAIVHDAGEVAGANIEIFFAFAPDVDDGSTKNKGKGFLLPHQVRPRLLPTSIDA